MRERERERERETKTEEEVPYGVAVWEIADGDGQRARNRWALHGIIKGSQKVTNCCNELF